MENAAIEIKPPATDAEKARYRKVADAMGFTAINALSKIPAERRQEFNERVAGNWKSPFHVAALQYAAGGVPVFPCLSDAKAPASLNGFHDATTDVATINGWWYSNPDFNIAFSPADVRLGVVDLDGPEAEAAWKVLIAEHSIPETREVSTPRGGRHIYFEGELPQTAWTPTNKRCLGEHIDTRGVGSYVLLPPSIVNGKQYKVLHEREIAPVPDWMVEKLKRSAEPKKAPENVEIDGQAAIERTTALLADLVKRGDVAISGSGGNNRTYALACELSDLGLSPAVCRKLLEEIWNPHCQPPWSGDELQTIITHASNYVQNEPGAYAVPPAAEVFANVQLPADPEVSLAPKIAAKLIQPIPFTDLLTRDVKPVEEVIPGLLEKNIATMLSGPGGVNKSRLALQWGLCIQAGIPIFGRTILQSTFVHLSYEDSKDEVTRRVQKITRRLAIPNADNAQLLNYADPDTMANGPMPSNTIAPPLATVTETEITLEPLYYELYGYLSSLPGHKFIVADSTYNVLRFTGQAKINETAVKQAIELLNYLCRATNSTILFLWHPSQAGQERGDSSGWSVAWNNTPRARLSLTAVKNTEGAYTLAVEKRNNGPKGQPITLHWNDGVLLPRSEVDSAEKNSLFLEACINVARLSSDNGAPITRQRNLDGWQIDEIERGASFRPSQREVKEELAHALRLGRLRYIKGYGKQQAGYFPIENDPALMRDTATG